MRSSQRILFLGIFFAGFSLSFLHAQTPVYTPLDYSDSSLWVALPFRDDAVDIAPRGDTLVSDSLKSIDVFFVYPTTYRGKEPWNADVRDEEQRSKIEDGSLKYQASVFNKEGRIYSPLYRQATYDSFADTVEGPEALEFAYQDVKAAFTYYLANMNSGRPIILASHSQGTYHARRLLKEFFDTPAMKSRLVAAYLVGFSIDTSIYEIMRPCENKDEINCYVTWSSYKKGFDPGKSVLYGNVCVNPVTWTRNKEEVPRSQQLGALMKSLKKKAKICGTQIHNNYLWVECKLPIIRSFNVLHIGDYNLFWFDVRQNISDRIAAYNRQ